MRIRASSLVGLAGSTIIAALLGLGGCAGGSKTETTTPEGSGGADTATGGAATTTAVATGGSTATASGGSTSTAGAFECAKGSPTGPKIAPGTNGTWGSVSDLAGGTFLYQDVDESKLTADTAALAGSVTYTGTVAPNGYTGTGLYFKDPQKCWNLSAYTGFRMTLSGSLGGGKLQFQVQTNSDYPIDTANKKGACEGTWSSGCGNNVATLTDANVTATATAVDVPFATLSGGSPNAFDASEVLGVQWQVNCPSDATSNCLIALTIGDVLVY